MPVVTSRAFRMIKNREKMPLVIKRQLIEISQWVRVCKRIDLLKYEMEKLFAKTKVQIGEYQDEKGVTHLFIRVGYKGKAHLLIQRICKTGH